MQLKWPKYQKPKDEYMGWMKHVLRNIWQLPIANNVVYEWPQRIAAAQCGAQWRRRPSSSLKWPRNGDGGKWKCDLSRGLYAFLQSHQTKGSKSDPALSSYLRWSLKLQHPLAAVFHFTDLKLYHNAVFSWPQHGISVLEVGPVLEFTTWSTALKTIAVNKGFPVQNTVAKQLLITLIWP